MDNTKQKQKTITVRNAIAHVFINEYPEKLQSDNGKEFSNNLVKSYLEKIEVDHIFVTHYHSQSQGAIEAFNSTVQRTLSFVYDNAKQEEI